MRVTAGDLQITDLTVELTKGDDAVRPLDGISVSVSSGSLALLLGPSGCGKTTLLSCLAAILKPTSGSITFGGTDITALAGRQLTEHRRHRVGVIFQAFNLVPSLNCVENVAVPMRSAGMGGRQANARAVELLEQVGLADRLTHKPGKLSGGQQQRVAIARALALDPPLVLADEPTAHLDYIQVEGVLRLIRSLTDGGRVVLVSTHDDRMLRLADQIIEMRPHSRPVEVATTVVTLPRGATLFDQGDPSDLVYIVETGTVDVMRDAPDGELVLAALGPVSTSARWVRCSVCPARHPCAPAPTPPSPVTAWRRSESSSARATSPGSSAAASRSRRRPFTNPTGNDGSAQRRSPRRRERSVHDWVRRSPGPVRQKSSSIPSDGSTCPTGSTALAGTLGSS